MRTRTLVILVALLLAGCSNGGAGKVKPAGGGGKGSLTVAAFTFGESQILAHMFADVLAKAGYKTSVKQLTNRQVVEPALETGEVDVVPEYLGTLTEFLNTKDSGPKAKPLASSDQAKTLAALRKQAAKHHLVVLEPSQATDQNVFAVTRDFATKYKLSRLSDLTSYKGKLVLGGPPDCPKRAFCQLGLERLYALKFTGFTSLDAGGPLTKEALKQGKVQLGLVFSSDGGIKTFDLQVLTDDKHLETVDNIVPVLNETAATSDVRDALQKVADALTTDDLIGLNQAVDDLHQDPAVVAKDWLNAKRLL